MTAKSARLPFRPGLSRFAYGSDGSYVRCGMCGGRLELRSATPAPVEHGGRHFRRWDYQCADHAFSGGQSYYEAAGQGAAAA